MDFSYRAASRDTNYSGRAEYSAARPLVRWLADECAGTPGAFGLVERGVGAREQLGGRLDPVPDGDPGGRRLAEGHGGEQALDHGERALPVAVGQQDGELLAAVAGDRVRRA